MKISLIKFLYFIFILLSTAIIFALAVFFVWLFGIIICNEKIYGQITSVINGVLTGCLASFIFIMVSSCKNEIENRSTIQNETTNLKDKLNFQDDMTTYDLYFNKSAYIESYLNTIQLLCNRIQFKKKVTHLILVTSELVKYINTNLTQTNYLEISSYLKNIETISNSLLI